MSKIIDAVQRYRKIEDVTSTKDDAPPVYLMDEIADMARGSPETADSIAEHISKRLANKSPIVKWKAMRLIRHLCNKGGSQFQRCMQRYAGSVRELVHFQGEKDPFKGDSLNQRVRDTAKDTIDVMYNSAPTPTSMSSGPKARMQGFGSTAEAPYAPQTSSSDAYSVRSQFTSSRSQSGGGGSRMVGFGSDGRSMQPPSASASDLTSTVTSAVSNLGGYIRSQFPGVNNENTKALHVRSGSQGDSGYVGFGSQDAVGSSGFSSSRSGGMGPGSGSLRGSIASVTASVMGSEDQLVGEICTPGGLRAAPDPEDLRKFVESASSMDGLRIGELLIQKMSSPSWQVVLRALYALEAVLQHGSSQACGEVAVMFQSDPSPVTKGLSSVQASVKERSARCLKLLLKEEDGVQQAASAAPSAQPGRTPAPAQGPLMDFLGEELVVAGTAAAPVQAAHAPVDFLGELSGAVPAVPAVTTPAMQPQHTAATAAANMDPFSSFSLDCVPAAAAPSAQLPQQAGLSGFGAPTPDLQLNNRHGPAPAAAGSKPPLEDIFSSFHLEHSMQPGPGHQQLQQQQQFQQQQFQQQQQPPGLSHMSGSAGAWSAGQGPPGGGMQMGVPVKAMGGSWQGPPAGTYGMLPQQQQQQQYGGMPGMHPQPPQHAGMPQQQQQQYGAGYGSGPAAGSNASYQMPGLRTASGVASSAMAYGGMGMGAATGAVATGANLGVQAGAMGLGLATGAVASWLPASSSHQQAQQPAKVNDNNAFDFVKDVFK